MVKQITSSKLKALEEKEGHYLIDVRTPEEWEHIGKPDGEALGMTTHFVSYQFQQGDGRILNPNFEKEMDALNLDQSKKIFFICRSGQRSDVAAEIYEKKNFDTYNVSDGFYVDETTPSWKVNKLPIK
jgi:rhodanese-related sulfurtransferase